jgi:hypothetical protein
MKKIGFFGLCVFWLLCMGMTVNAALLSPAISVIQDDFEMIKTGVGTNTVSFSQENFTSVLGDTDFSGISVQTLPDPADGVLMLGMETVLQGQIIEKTMLDALRFIPAEEGKTAVFHFLPCGTDYEKPFICTVYMLDTLNFAPTARACTVSAKESIAVYGTLSASDPDGDEITYHAASMPKNGELSLSDWFAVPEYSLAEAVNGAVFADNYGEITRIREKLRYFPEDVRLKKLAGNLLLMGQAGQYNFKRCLARGESAAAQLAVFEFAKSALNAAFLLNKTYMPYYKWSFRALRALPRLSELSAPLEYLISSGNASADEVASKLAAIERISLSVIAELRASNLTDFCQNELEGHAYSVNNKIPDPEIRNLHILYGV